MEFFPTLLLRNVAIIERNDGVFALLKRLIIEHGNWHPSLFQPSLRYSRGGNGKENRRGEAHSYEGGRYAIDIEI